jgi:hypothetical protein
LGYRPATPGGQAKGKLTTYFRAASALEKAGLVVTIVRLNDVTADAEAEESEQELGRCAGVLEEFSNLVYREVHQ